MARKPKDQKTDAARIYELEEALRDAERKVAEMREEKDDALRLVSEMREFVEDRQAVMEEWRETFKLELGDDGEWHWSWAPGDLVERHNTLRDTYSALVLDHNKLVDRFNRNVAPSDPGRPLAASDAQVAEVRAQRKKGASLRVIAERTSLGLRTVRTILERDKGTDRTTKKRAGLRKKELDRLRQAEWRGRKRSLDTLPKRIDETQRRGEALVKAAKGLGA
jgi:hypothetical protein